MLPTQVGTNTSYLINNLKLIIKLFSLNRKQLETTIKIHKNNFLENMLKANRYGTKYNKTKQNKISF